MDRDIVLYSRKSMNYLSHLASQDIFKFFYTHHNKPLTNRLARNWLTLLFVCPILQSALEELHVLSHRPADLTHTNSFNYTVSP